MSRESSLDQAELRRAFLDYERTVVIQNYMVGCILGIVFMPAGYFMDLVVYPQYARLFLEMRLLCSFLLAVVWAILGTPVGRRYYRILGLVEVSLPIFFISWMIYMTDGARSPYYAGLNLVLLGAGIVLRWSLVDSIAVLMITMAMYLTACFSHKGGPVDSLRSGIFFNNFYFLISSGAFIITGTFFYSRIRFREFMLRFELNKNRQALEETNSKLLELDRVKSRFFANISHELRTPLTLLLAPLEAVMFNTSRVPDTELRESLATMRANGMRLLKLINDLLDLVKLESGRMEVRREPVPMEAFLAGLCNSVKTVAQDKRLRLLMQVEEKLDSVLVDRDKLEKVILNLLFNALKFTPSGGQVSIQAAREQDFLVLRVIDSGMGIAETHLPYVFDRFWQADTSSRRKYQGTGIGLALVKELVEVQGGQVHAHSQVGKGTTMEVRLPFIPMGALVPDPQLQEVAQESESVQGVSHEWLSGLYRRAELFPSMTALQDTLKPVETFARDNRPRILIADDEPDMLRFLKSQLSTKFQVLEAVDGQQAIEKGAQFLPDLILLDMMMPEKDGLQACRELRERTSTQGIPIILLTARADEETKLATLSAGASDFLSKPFSTTELHVRIKNLVDSHQWQRRLSRQNQILEATLEQLKETESQLVQSEKLASLGRMSAGIIHEINNPLNYANTGLYMLRSKGKLLAPEEQEDFQEILRDIEEGVLRVKNIVGDLRSFSHPNSEQMESVPVEKTVDSALRFLSNEWREKVRVDKEIELGLTIHANANKIIQVWVNMVQNAIDAMKEKTFAPGDGPSIRILGRREGTRQLVIFRDNGQGITREDLSKVFDPFFTTKDVGQGMGLGLSICYRIVQECGGKITVLSEPGKFCEFTMEFSEKIKEIGTETAGETVAN